MAKRASATAKRSHAKAKPPPATKDWKATLDVQPHIRPQPETLRVAGEVDVGNIGASAHLKEASPQGTNPEILLLRLTITLDREGVPKRVYKEAKFHKVAKKGEYKTVQILWEGEVIADMPVVNVG